MVKSGSVVASEGLSGSGSWDGVVAVRGRILENGSVRERKWVSKTFGNNRGWKVHGLLAFLVRAGTVNVNTY